jgi:hypothetical protein
MNVPDGPFCKGKEAGFCDDFQNGSIGTGWTSDLSVYVSDSGATELGAMRVFNGTTRTTVIKDGIAHVEFSFLMSSPSTMSDIRLQRNAACTLKVSENSRDVLIGATAESSAPTNLNCKGSGWHHITLEFPNNGMTNLKASCDRGNVVTITLENCASANSATLYINANTPGSDVLIDDVWVH